jgi:hypothetical protein
MIADVILSTILVAAVGLGVGVAVRIELGRSSHVPIVLLVSLLGLESSVVAAVVDLWCLHNETLFDAMVFPFVLFGSVFLACLSASITIFAYPRKSTRRFGALLLVCALSPIPVTHATLSAARLIVTAMRNRPTDAPAREGRATPSGEPASYGGATNRS